VTAHQVNVEGTLKLLDFAQAQGESHGRTVVFLYPSSIAAYGLPDLETKAAAGAVREHEWNNPTTMYGCNKLYCEHLGRYFALHYKQLAAETLSGKVDFRAIRFPGLISAVTVPSGGTSDFAPEMIHAAARGEPYACFVRPDTRIPFMVMSDAVDGLVRLARAERARLGRTVYNITAFNPSADEIRSLVLAGFPGADISFEPDLKRQVIVDSWPADVDDSAARSDWGLDPRYDLEGGFNEFLIPRIRGRY
jgi:nucleoside-diphosphate-sugar epimerase